MTAAATPALLLVDDDPTFCEVMRRALTRRGFRVALAHDAEQALRAVADGEPPAYAVIDLKMPGDSGLTLIPRLRARSAEVRIVMLTGYASIATAVEAIKLGATHYLTKPADADEIVAALHKDEGDDSVEIKGKPLSIKRLEWEHLQKILVEHDYNISAAARALGMHRRTLQRKLEKRPVKD